MSTTNMSYGEYLKRNIDKKFPDFGACEIQEEWREFLYKSKEQFNEKWNKPFIHQEKLCDFNQVTLLGTGAFGEVILIKHKGNGTYYAMKAIEKSKIIKRKAFHHIKNEKMVLQSINFPLTVYLTYFFKDNSYIYMVMPYIDGGELFEQLSEIGHFNEVQTRFYISQVILAIEYLHYLDLIYRDLKPENLILDHTGYLRMTDFGHCKLMREKRTFTICGTPEYLAPEVIMSLGYGKSVDWWAVGVLTYELIVGHSPFSTTNTMKTYEKIVFLKYEMPSSFSDELKDFVRNILQKDLTKRYGNLKNGADDIKYHKWFETIDWLAILNRKVSAPFQPMCKKDVTKFKKQPKFNLIPRKTAKQNLYSEEFEDL